MHALTALLLLVQFVWAPALDGACCGPEDGSNGRILMEQTDLGCTPAPERPAEDDTDSGVPCCVVCTTCCGQTATSAPPTGGFRGFIRSPFVALPFDTRGTAPAYAIWHPPRV